MTFERLGTFADITPGTSPRGELINSSGRGLPFFQGSKEFGPMFPKAERYTEHPVRTAKKGDILVSVRAPVGEVNFAPEDCAIGRGLMAVSPKSPTVGNFLFYFLKSLRGRWDSLGSTGSVFENLSVASLRQLEVPTHLPLRSIGEVLMNFDLKIQSNQRISIILEGILRTVFESWFVSFDPVKETFSGTPRSVDATIASSFPDTLEEVDGQLIPDGWRFETLDSLGLVLESGSRPKGGVKGIHSGVPSIGAESIHGIGVFDYSKTKFVSEDFFQSLRRGIPRDLDVLLYKDGGKPGEFKPRVGMFGLGFPFKDYAINEHVFLLRSEALGQAFLYFLVTSERVLDVLRERGAKAAIPGINQTDVRSLVTIVPNQDALRRFDEVAIPMLKKILVLANESNLLAQIRDELAPRLLTAELELPSETLAA